MDYVKYKIWKCLEVGGIFTFYQAISRLFYSPLRGYFSESFISIKICYYCVIVRRYYYCLQYCFLQNTFFNKWKEKLCEKIWRSKPTFFCVTFWHSRILLRVCTIRNVNSRHFTTISPNTDFSVFTSVNKLFSSSMWVFTFFLSQGFVGLNPL